MLDFFKRLLGMPTKQEQAIAEVPYKVEVAPVVEAAPYKVPEPAATTPIPLVVESVPAKPTAPARTAKSRAPAKAKAPAKPRATKAKPQA